MGNLYRPFDTTGQQVNTAKTFFNEGGDYTGRITSAASAFPKNMVRRGDVKGTQAGKDIYIDVNPGYMEHKQTVDAALAAYTTGELAPDKLYSQITSPTGGEPRRYVMGYGISNGEIRDDMKGRVKYYESDIIIKNYADAERIGLEQFKRKSETGMAYSMDMLPESTFKKYANGKEIYDWQRPNNPDAIDWQYEYVPASDISRQTYDTVYQAGLDAFNKSYNEVYGPGGTYGPPPNPAPPITAQSSETVTSPKTAMERFKSAVELKKGTGGITPQNPLSRFIRIPT